MYRGCLKSHPHPILPSSRGREQEELGNFCRKMRQKFPKPIIEVVEETEIKEPGHGIFNPRGHFNHSR